MHIKQHLRRGLLLAVATVSVAFAAVGAAGAEDTPPPVSTATTTPPPPAPTPPEEEVTPPGEDTAPSGEDAAPPGEDTAPPEEAPPSTEAPIGDAGTAGDEAPETPVTPEMTVAPETTVAPDTTVAPEPSPEGAPEPTIVPTTTTPVPVTPPAPPKQLTPNDPALSLLAATAPSAPLSPKATPGNGSVKLTWAPPANNGGATVIKYTVQRFVPGTGWKTIATPTGLSYTAGGLTNGTKYSFRVAAHNPAGIGAFSTVVSATPRKAPSAPTVTTVWPGNGSMTLKWQAPSGNGAAVDYYQVQRSETLASWTTFPAQKPAEFIDTNVTNGVSYFYKVRAHNEAGWGPFSTIVVGVPRTVPSAPASCSAVGWGYVPKFLEYSWEPPHYNGGAPIRSYVIQVFSNGSFLGMTGASATPPYVGDDVEVWEPGTYAMHIYAVNAAGWGPPCIATTILT
jgi:titin